MRACKLCHYGSYSATSTAGLYKCCVFVSLVMFVSLYGSVLFIVLQFEISLVYFVSVEHTS